MVRPVFAALTIVLGVVLVAPSSPSSDTPPDLEKRGCCSHHHGVCGCAAKAHRLVCCDNSLSPSCGC